MNRALAGLARHWLAPAILLMTLTPPAARAMEGWGSNYLPGFYGDFGMAAFPEEGTYLSQFLAVTRGPGGHGGSVVEVPGIIHATGWELFGGHYAAAFYPSLIGAWDDSGSRHYGRVALGDFYLVPAALHWQWAALNLVVFEGLIAPTGYYLNGALNSSRNVWSFDHNAMLTWNLPGAMELNMNLGLMQNLINPASAYDSGDELHFDYTLGHYVMTNLGLGVNGSYYRQVTADHAHAVTLIAAAGEAVTVGPVINYTPRLGDRDVSFTLKWLHEVHAEGRQPQDYFIFRVFLGF